MIKNKRGVFLAIYLPLMTLFMCGLMIGIYIYQSGTLPNSLVSPKAVMDIQDQKDIYELWENQTIYDSIKQVGISTPNLDKKTHDKFCKSFAALDSKIRKIIYDATAPEEFCNSIYKFNLVENNKKLSVERGEIKLPDLRLSVSDKSKISFPVTVSYSIQKKYLINLDDLK
jgi:hypothetical protein